MDSFSVIIRNSIPSSLHLVFQQKCMKTDQVWKIFLLSNMKCQQGTIVSLCLAGRFSVRSVAGSWSDLHACVWGTSGFFCVLAIPRAWSVIPFEAWMSICPINYHMLSFAGNLLIRQMARALDQHSLFLSRNGGLTSHSGIFVFKYPRIVDKWNN